MKRAALAAIYILLSVVPAPAFDWDYSEAKFDLTTEAVLGSASDFERWKQGPLDYLGQKFQHAIPAEPVLVSSGPTEKKNGYTLTPVELVFPKITARRDDLHYVVVIARPENPKPRPVIIAINGHSEVGGEGHGQAPETLFRSDGHGDRLARDGYTVVAFPNTIHEPLAEIAKTTDYSIIWARLADLALSKLSDQFPPGTKYVGLGNAAGGLTSLVLTIMRPDIEALVTNGAFFSLEQTRREYRIYVHPFCHDFRAFFGYSAVYALVAPKPLMIQMGKQDGLWLGSGPSKSLDWYSGTKRGALSDETVGAFLQLREVWGKYGAPISLDEHNRGHEDVDVPAVEAFVEKISTRATQ